MKVNIGGDRLGSGAKMNVELHNYYRSTHNLSKNFKSSMTCGLLYPAYVNIGLNGDKFEIDTKTQVRTIPTQGPLFGSFKMQVDWFVCPVRLYQGILHNNPINIGMSMQEVKLPIIELTSFDKEEDYSTSQIHPANLWRYLGLAGLGKNANGIGERVTREINATPLLAYYDIFKNYYANKQEDYAYVVTAETNEQVKSSLHVIKVEDSTGNTVYVNAGQTVTLDVTRQYTVTITGERLLKPNGTPNITFTHTGKVRNYTLESGATDNKITLFINYYGSATTGSITINQDTFSYALDKISLKQFDLNEIDDMRTEILRDTNLGVAYNVTETDLELYSESFKAVNINGETAYALQYPLAGMVTKTYQSDLFNNWIKTEFVEGSNGIAEITKIDTSDGLKMDALNLAQKVYNMLNRIALAGGTYEDWQEAVYTQSSIRKAETPMYVGGMSSEIMFEEVIATTADTKDQALGTLGGRGKQIGMKGGHIEFKCEEPCIIMAIASLTPRISYSQGNKWFLTDLFSIDDLHKPALDGIGYQDLLVEQMAWWGTTLASGDKRPSERVSAGKVPAWLNYMTDVDECYGDFALEGGKSFMSLTRNYDYQKNGNEMLPPVDVTTYIDPEKFNYAFASTELMSQNFWTEIQFDIKARRLMSAKQIPNL